MKSDPQTHRIGWVAGVESERLDVELDPATTGLVKGGVAGILPVGSINSYITVPAGPARLVAVVTAIRLSETPPRGGDPYAAEEALSRRLEAVMVGRFEGSEYSSGISTYPPLYAPVSSATPDEIEVIFQPSGRHSITLGEAVVAPGIDVRLDVDRLLARHTAIVGSTGAGKSSTVTAIIEEILRLRVPSANIIIFDSNGEYGAAFGPETERGRQANSLILGPEPGADSGLVSPHWFMDNEDHLALLRASEGAQAPLLQRAVADARLGGSDSRNQLTLLVLAHRTCETARSILNDSEAKKPQANLAAILEPLDRHFGELAEAATTHEHRQDWEELAEIASGYENVGLDADSWDPIDMPTATQLEDLIRQLEERIAAGLGGLGMGSEAIASDFDAPRYYSMEYLNAVSLPQRIALESLHEPRIRAYAATLLMRLSRLLADARYNFMTRVPQHNQSLARFLRLLLGTDPLRSCEPGERPPWADAYEARAGGAHQHSVTVLDLSLIAADVLENVTALLGRLILDFAQRVQPRSSLPILLVLEEAHRYIPEEEFTRSRVTFERIAKEGRKYGVGLLLASQRPAELARTVLAQCGTLIAHRTVSQIDQDLIRHATPFANREILRQLPGLGTQHAVVLGEATPVPSYVRIKHVSDAPMGRDPEFIEAWQQEAADTDLFEAVAETWEEGVSAGGDSQGAPVRADDDEA